MLGPQNWWGKQNTGLKVALAGGCFTLLAAAITCLGSILPPFLNYFLSRPIETPTNFSLKANNAWEFLETPILFTETDGILVGLVPQECLLADYGGMDEVLDPGRVRKDVTGKSFAFDLVTEQPLIISNGVIEVVEYRSPPDLEPGTEISLFDPPGMGGVPIVFFSERAIQSKNLSYVVTFEDNVSLRLDPGDAVTLVFQLSFSDPGIYKLKFVVEGQMDLSQPVTFSSSETTFAWYLVENMESFPIKSSMGLAEMSWKGNCP